MSLTQRLGEYIAAAFTGIWIQSQEHEDALAEIGRLCRDRKWSLAVWDVDRGLQVSGDGSTPGANTATDPVAAIRAVNAIAPAKSEPEGSALLILPNFHRFMQSTEIVQALARSETGSRRIDVAEFIEFCVGCGIDPATALTDLAKRRR
jgi:hypothetical protein